METYAPAPRAYRFVIAKEKETLAAARSTYFAMRLFTLETSLWLPQPVEDVFSFFADAANLESLTPPWLRFKIQTSLPIEMAAGARIDYRLRYRGCPLRWRTEILAWEPPHRFVDSQIKGPYRRWVHEHVFVAQDGGTLATDCVEYALLGGAFTNALFVGRDLERIFAYRRQRMLTIFGGTSAAKR
jgi:ligand-binding SRPBCC domain-containing protein